MKIKIFELSLTKFGLISVAEVLAIVLHNLVSGLTGSEEAVFFTLAVFLLPVYLVVNIIYTGYKKYYQHD